MFFHLVNSTTNANPDQTNIFEIPVNELKTGELVVVPKSVLFGCKHFFQPGSELPPEPIEKSFLKTNIGGTTFFEAQTELEIGSTGVHSSRYNYAKVPAGKISATLLTSFLNSQPTEKLLVGEFNNKSYENLFYVKGQVAIPDRNTVKELSQLSEYFGINAFVKLFAINHLFTKNYGTYALFHRLTHTAHRKRSFIAGL